MASVAAQCDTFLEQAIMEAIDHAEDIGDGGMAEQLARILRGIACRVTGATVDPHFCGSLHTPPYLH